ncbi:hypothetical protein [Asanoa sp. NPDC050611]|uniref:hypothetical protein n=1 Tax=Asanoa sp. NPDC050611 TaxID=3157098 RepID=UPI0033EF18A4
MALAEPLVLDDSGGSRELVALKQALAARGWREAREILAGQHGGARTRLIGWAAPLVSRPFLEEVHAADPGDTAAAAMLATRIIGDAWAIRTSKRASEVSAERFASFHAVLREAEKLLEATIAIDPTDPAVLTCRLTTARGLELGLDEARSRYAAVAAVDPHHLPAQDQLLQQLAPKWGGSLEEMHAFARESATAVPEGAHNGVLAAQAYFEHWATVDGRRRAVGRATLAALREAADRSVLSPAFPRTPGWVGVANMFAWVLMLAHEYRRAYGVFGVAGTWVSQQPWQGDLDTFRGCRGKAGVMRLVHR